MRRRTDYLRREVFFAAFLRAPPFFADDLRAAFFAPFFRAAMVISVKEWNARSNPRWFGRASGWTPERLPHRGTDSWRAGDVDAPPAYTVTPMLQR